MIWTGTLALPGSNSSRLAFGFELRHLCKFWTCQPLNLHEPIPYNLCYSQENPNTFSKNKDHIFWKKLLDARPIAILPLFLIAEYQFIQGSNMFSKKTISGLLGQLGLVMWLNLGNRIQQKLLVVQLFDLPLFLFCYLCLELLKLS